MVSVHCMCRKPSKELTMNISGTDGKEAEEAMSPLENHNTLVPLCPKHKDVNCACGSAKKRTRNFSRR